MLLIHALRVAVWVWTLPAHSACYWQAVHPVSKYLHTLNDTCILYVSRDSPVSNWLGRGQRGYHREEQPWPDYYWSPRCDLGKVLVIFSLPLSSCDTHRLDKGVPAPWNEGGLCTYRRADLKIPYVREVILEKYAKQHRKLETHPNPLLHPLLDIGQPRRLKRTDPARGPAMR